MSSHDDRRRILRFPSKGEPHDEARDDALSRLLEIAGPRPEPPEKLRREVERAAHAAWREKVHAHSRTRRRRLWQLAAAAVVVAGVGITLWVGVGLGPSSSPATPTLARVEAVQGSVTARIPGSRTALPRSVGDAVLLTQGAALPAGSVIDTGDGEREPAALGRAALRLRDGTSVRLDRESRLRLASARELVLERGAVYLDTGGEVTPEPEEALTVRTSFGVARDIGTRFEVRLSQEALRVRVREGRVEVETAGARHPAAAGIALTVDPQGRVERAVIPAHGADWGWVLETSPPFELEGASLTDYLAWLERETGWRVRYADPGLEGEADEITLHGSIAGLRPDETPAAVLAGAGLDHRIEGGTLVIRPKDPSESRL